MTIYFKTYEARDKNACLSLFDANCPQYFAPNERFDYEEFLDDQPNDYLLCIADEAIVGVFGVFAEQEGECRINWIMLNSSAQGLGIGTKIMEKAIKQAMSLDAKIIHIATSQVAYKFFEKFNAKTVKETKNGWGPDMDKIDMEIRL